MMHAVQNKNAPAYKGARFDADGFCLAHSDVLLCKVIDGRYKTVRKICFKCGSATLTNKRRRRKNLLQRSGRRRSPKPRDDTTGVSGIGKGRRHAKKKPERHAGRDASADEAKAQKNEGGRQEGGGARPSLLVESAASNKKKNAPRAALAEGASGRRRREQTGLAPLSPFEGVPRSPNDGPSLSPSEITRRKKKATDKKIEEMMHLMPPLYAAAPRSSRAGSSKRLDASGSSSGVKKGLARTSDKSTKYTAFDGDGHCRAHPEVRLAKKCTKKGDWEIVSGVCPQCCASAVMAHERRRSASSSNIQTRGKELNPNTNADDAIDKAPAARSDDCSRTQPTSASSSFSSYPSTPKSPKPAFSADYFTFANHSDVRGMALDIDRGEQMVADLELNESCVSNDTTKRRNAGREPPGRRL